MANWHMANWHIFVFPLFFSQLIQYLKLIWLLLEFAIDAICKWNIRLQHETTEWHDSCTSGVSMTFYVSFKTVNNQSLWRWQKIKLSFAQHLTLSSTSTAIDSWIFHYTKILQDARIGSGVCCLSVCSSIRLPTLCPIYIDFWKGWVSCPRGCTQHIGVV